MTKEEAQARWICCPMCDKKKCERKADDCDVKIYLRNKTKSEVLNEFADDLERIEKKYNADTIPWTIVHEAQAVQRKMMEEMEKVYG